VACTGIAIKGDREGESNLAFSVFAAKTRSNLWHEPLVARTNAQAERR
jgi:hypothetical protein